MNRPGGGKDVWVLAALHEGDWRIFGLVGGSEGAGMRPVRSEFVAERRFAKCSGAERRDLWRLR